MIYLPRYIYRKNRPNVGKNTMQGSYGPMGILSTVIITSKRDLWFWLSIFRLYVGPCLFNQNIPIYLYHQSITKLDIDTFISANTNMPWLNGHALSEIPTNKKAVYEGLIIKGRPSGTTIFPMTLGHPKVPLSPVESWNFRSISTS